MHIPTAGSPCSVTEPNSRDWAAGVHAGPGVGRHERTHPAVWKEGGQRGGEHLGWFLLPPCPACFPFALPPRPLAPLVAARSPRDCGLAQSRRSGRARGLSVQTPRDPARASAEGTREVCAATAPHSCLAPRVSQAGLSLQPGEKRFQRAGSPRLDGETGAGSGLSHLHARGTRSHRPPAFKPAASQRLRLPEQDRLPPRTW